MQSICLSENAIEWDLTASVNQDLSFGAVVVDFAGAKSGCSTRAVGKMEGWRWLWSNTLLCGCMRVRGKRVRWRMPCATWQGLRGGGGLPEFSHVPGGRGTGGCFSFIRGGRMRWRFRCMRDWRIQCDSSNGWMRCWISRRKLRGRRRLREAELQGRNRERRAQPPTMFSVKELPPLRFQCGCGPRAWRRREPRRPG